MIYTHDEVEVADVLTLTEAVSKMAGSQITARMLADVNLAILWFQRNVDFSGKDPRPGMEVVSDWHWDGCVVMESLEATGPGSLAHAIYMNRRLTEAHVRAWIVKHPSWKLKEK